MSTKTHDKMEQYLLNNNKNVYLMIFSGKENNERTFLPKVEKTLGRRGKWRGALVAVFQCVVAWLTAALVYQAACLIF